MGINKVVHLLKSMVVSIAVFALLLFFMAFILYKGSLSGFVEEILVVIIYLVSCFAGGFTMGKQEEKRHFLWGACFGGLFFLLLFLISLMAGKGNMDNSIGENLRVLLLCVLGGMLGGMVS